MTLRILLVIAVLLGGSASLARADARPPSSATPVPLATEPAAPRALATQGPRPPQRRWSWWKPWAVVAGGAVFAGVGVGLFGVMSDRYDTYDRAVADFRADTSNPQSAVLPEDIRALEDDARAMRAVTVSALAVGGVMIATGITMVVMNTPRHPPVVVAPRAGPGTVGLVLSGRW